MILDYEFTKLRIILVKSSFKKMNLCFNLLKSRNRKLKQRFRKFFLRFVKFLSDNDYLFADTVRIVAKSDNANARYAFGKSQFDLFIFAQRIRLF